MHRVFMHGFDFASAVLYLHAWSSIHIPVLDFHA